MNKKLITDKIIYNCKRASQFSNQYTWAEVKKLLKEENISLQDDDVLEIGFEEGWNEGDTARDDMYFVSVKRQREESDAEFEKRKIKTEELRSQTKKRRLELYLELKKEFEDN